MKKFFLAVVSFGLFVSVSQAPAQSVVIIGSADPATRVINFSDNPEIGLVTGVDIFGNPLPPGIGVLVKVPTPQGVANLFLTPAHVVDDKSTTVPNGLATIKNVTVTFPGSGKSYTRSLTDITLDPSFVAIAAGVRPLSEFGAQGRDFAIVDLGEPISQPGYTLFTGDSQSVLGQELKVLAPGPHPQLNSPFGETLLRVTVSIDATEEKFRFTSGETTLFFSDADQRSFGGSSDSFFGTPTSGPVSDGTEFETLSSDSGTPFFSPEGELLGLASFAIDFPPGQITGWSRVDSSLFSNLLIPEAQRQISQYGTDPGDGGGDGEKNIPEPSFTASLIIVGVVAWSVRKKA